MTVQPWLSVILAAGQGTRMRSAKPKVLHAVAGRPMIAHVAATALDAGASQLAVVVGPDMDNAQAALADLAPHAQFFLQTERLGTAHAVLAARGAIAEFSGDVLILCGDTPLLKADTLKRLREALRGGAAIAVLGFEAADPAGYGRLLIDEQGTLQAIREDRDASDAERAVTLCNSGVMAFSAGAIVPIIERIGNGNAKGEYYLTDAIEIARKDGHKVEVVTCPEDEVFGVNDRVQLAQAEAAMQARLREQAMLSGVTLIAPNTVTFSYDTKLGRDVVVEPNVFFGTGVTIEAEAEIKANSYIEQSHIRRRGPSSGHSPGSVRGLTSAPGAKIGNFVEIKKSVVEAGAKVSHLSYIGDARVGAKANIGAGTIICNYDGFKKYFTEIGEGAFVGSNSALVAPVKIGDGAYIGSGSVITKNVDPDALALERNEQTQRDGWAERKRKKMQGS